MSGRTLAIGDIHGCDIAFDVLLDRLAPDADDTVVILGDVIDRGPGSKPVVERLLELRHECRLVFITGNHEEMLLDALAGGEWSQGWLRFGGQETLESYGGNLDDIPAEHLEFLRSGVNFFETERDIFVHANLRPHLPLDRQSTHWLRWCHMTGNERPHPSGKRVVCGHTSQKNGQPLRLPGYVCIDTFAHGGQPLTCLDCDADQLHQATQTGEYRQFALDDIPVTPTLMSSP